MNDPIPVSPADPSTAPSRDDELESILDDLREQSPDVPHGEFCEGFVAALVCCRREIGFDEYLAVLLGSESGDDVPAAEGSNPFADAVQRERFAQRWLERQDEVAAALDADIETLEDEAAYEPRLLDLHGMIASVPADQREGLEASELPAFAQLWALGFMAVVDTWPEEWVPPRDREDRRLVREALAAIEVLTGDDPGPPEVSPYDEAEPPSVSRRRFEQFGTALAAVYDLHDVFRSLGPRVEPLRKSSEPGRNDPCWCGSGKKFKKCHGA